MGFVRLPEAYSGGMVGAVASFGLNAQRWGLLRLEALGQRLRPRHARAPHLLTGERGEFEALFFLRRAGYTVVERRWRTPELNGDVDLIAWDGECLCLVEVKTRTARDRTPAAVAVDEEKRRMLRGMARAYRRTLPKEMGEAAVLRFDVVSVYLLGKTAECELVRDAFSLNSARARNEGDRFGV